jgi:protoporphyrinogen oxidase
MAPGDGLVDRRAFILSSAKALSALALSSLPGCRRREAGEISFPGALAGPSVALGHRLLEKGFPAATRERRVPVVIVGGGIAGLSAGWKLSRSGMGEFEILELEPEVGGVSRSGKNSITPFPWGAHYIPLPTDESRGVRELFEDLGVIEGRTAAGRPRYKEEYLCFSPQERLYIHGKWQEGFLPVLGAKGKDLDQFERFRDLVFRFKGRRGKDGRKAFAIPLEFSSRDPNLLALDRISMPEFLRRQGMDSPLLHWYVNYGCRDDYGCPYSEVSAWAGLHYYCSRDGGSGSEESAVLTWPEGNGWVVKQLKKRLRSHIRTDSLVFRLANRGKEVWVDVYHPGPDTSTRIRAEQVIYACPRIFTRHMITEEPGSGPDYLNRFHYAPWLVANLSLKSLPLTRHGMPLAWDNVIYDSPSLGYVVSTHQSLATRVKETVLTYYYAMVEGPPAEQRTRLLRTSWKDWVKFILKDLSRPHPEIYELVSRLDIFRWGHAMVQPRVGFVWGKARVQAARPLGNIHFAHSDLSGFSIFEEAHYRGVSAAERILTKYHVPFTSSL